jgi:hypothetical protein
MSPREICGEKVVDALTMRIRYPIAGERIGEDPAMLW